MTSPAFPAPIKMSRDLGIPAVVAEAGPSAAFAWDEFFAATLSNKHTRLAYLRAVRRFLAWVGCPLLQITPGMVGRYLAHLPVSAPSRKLELAALRSFFDHLVLRHAVVLNPASSVRGERYSVVEGTTPEITSAQSARLLASIPAVSAVDLRDRAVLACLMFTAARAGAVAGLKVGSLQHDGSQYRLRFAEKGGKRREIPVRHDLQLLLLAYIAAAGLVDAPAGSPLFRTAKGKTGRLTGWAMTGADVCRMMKRRLAAAGLPASLSPHSFRVSVTTDLLAQNVPLEDVQTLLGHADPRTTRLYDRRQRAVTRNLVERISSGSEVFTADSSQAGDRKRPAPSEDFP